MTGKEMHTDTAVHDYSSYPIMKHLIPGLELAILLDGQVIVCGHCKDQFSINYDMGEEYPPATIIWTRTKDQVQKEEPLYKYVGIIPVADQSRIHLIINYRDIDQDLIIIPGSLANDTSALLKYIDYNCWDILSSIGQFSDAWHKLLGLMPAQYILNSSPLKCESHRFVNFLRQLKANLNEENPIKLQITSKGSIRIKYLPLKDRYNLELMHNGKVIKIPDSWVDDALGIGYQLPSDILENDYNCFSIRRISDNQTLAFQFLNLSHFDSHKYKTKIESITPVIRGWSINEIDNSETYETDILLDGLFFTTVENTERRGDLIKNGISACLGGFKLKFSSNLLGKGFHTLSIRHPDGTLSPDSRFSSAGRPHTLLSDLACLKKRISIIIPVYNAPDELENCLEHLFTYSTGNFRCIIVDDQSTDPDIKPILARYSTRKNVLVLHNEENLGFSGSVNKGLMAAEDDDVIILNSDVRVTPRWLQSLILTANSLPKVATVTPMSDNSGAFSAPAYGEANELPSGADEISYATSYRRNSLRLTPKTATGNGFCMFISRAAIKEAGGFDEKAFPRGYGEENDFCMRTLRLGWQHLIDDRTYIFHDNGASFSTSKKDLIAAGRQKIEERYPEYSTAIKDLRIGEKMNFVRYAARVAMKTWRQDSRTRLLFLDSSLETAQNMVRYFSDFAQCWVLVAENWRLNLFRLDKNGSHPENEFVLSALQSKRYSASREYDSILAGILYDLDIDIVHVLNMEFHSANAFNIVKTMTRHVISSFKCLNSPGSLSSPDVVCLSDKARNFIENCDLVLFEDQKKLELLASAEQQLASGKFIYLPEIVPESNWKYHAWNGCVHLVIPASCQESALDFTEKLAGADEDGYIKIHYEGNPCIRKKEKGFSSLEYCGKSLYDNLEDLKPAACLITDDTFKGIIKYLRAGIPLLAPHDSPLSREIQEWGLGWLLPDIDYKPMIIHITRLLANSRQMKEKSENIRYWLNRHDFTGRCDLLCAEYHANYMKMLGKSNGSTLVATLTNGKPLSENLSRFIDDTFPADFIRLELWEDEISKLLPAGKIRGVMIHQDALPDILLAGLKLELGKYKIPYVIIDGNEAGFNEIILSFYNKLKGVEMKERL